MNQAGPPRSRPGNRRRKLVTAVGLVAVSGLMVLAGCGGSEPAGTVEVEPFKNVIFIMVDTLGSDHLSCYGYENDTTPFMCGLAAEGIQLQGYSVSSWTRTSIATTLTGLYPQRHQTVTRADGLPATVPFLPKILRDAGFHTVGYAANATVGRKFGFARGYRKFLDHKGSKFTKPPAAAVNDEVLRLIEDLSEPFYLYVLYLDPHDPYVPAKPWGDPGGSLVDPIQPDDIKQKKVPMTKENLRRLKAGYDGAVHEVDVALERLFADLAARGALDETLVVITADHGEEFGEHGGLTHGRTLYEEVLRVPLIFWSSTGTLPAYRSDVRFHQVDLLPTVLEGLGIDPPGGIDGRSRWRDIISGELGEREEYFFFLDLAKRAELGLIVPPFKLIHRKGGNSNLLFNLKKDRGERKNLIHLSETRFEMLHKMVAFHNELSLSRSQREITKLDRDTREQLAALGYMEVDTPDKELENRDIPPRLEVHDTRVSGLFAGVPSSALETTVDLTRPSAQLLGGWAGRGAKGTWSRPEASFVMPTRPGVSELVMHGDLDTGRRRARCRISLNGDRTASLVITPGPFTLTVPLPEEVRSAESIYVDLHVRPAHRLPSGAEVGLRWRRFALR
ncbi:MAG: sulfatase [bacterium]|nr:sulfatase [bacterium]